MTPHAARFKRCSSRLTGPAAYLVEQVEQQVVPVFLGMAGALATPPADPTEGYIAKTLIRVRLPG